MQIVMVSAWSSESQHSSEFRYMKHQHLDTTQNYSWPWPYEKTRLPAVQLQMQ